MLTSDELAWLHRIAGGMGGAWPDRPFLRSPASRPLMRKGLVEVIDPGAPYIPYARITAAGRDALADAARPPLSTTGRGSE